jgi:hypothetical protein
LKGIIVLKIKNNECVPFLKTKINETLKKSLLFINVKNLLKLISFKPTDNEIFIIFIYFYELINF